MASEFLPPDPHADTPPPATAPAPGRTQFLAPATAPTGASATAAVAWGAAGLAVLAFTIGTFFFLALPASITGLVLGRRAQRREPPPAHADVAVVIAVVGIVLGIVAAVVWIVLGALDVTVTGQAPGGRGDGDLTFQVIHLLAAR